MYGPEEYKRIKDQICDGLAEGCSLRELCRRDGVPSMSTVMRWLDEDGAFQEQYARAKDLGMEALAEDILDISDNARNDWMERNGGDEQSGWILNGESIQRSRLRVDSRKWLLSKLAPKKYGDRQILAGDPDAPLKHDHTVGLSAETAGLLASLSLKAGPSGSGDEAPVQD